jgi:hypothetical protein
MFNVFSRYAAPSAVLMFNSGPTHGEAVEEYRGDPFYHASLSADEYSVLFDGIGFEIIAHAVEDWQTGGRPPFGSHSGAAKTGGAEALTYPHNSGEVN